MSLPQTPLTHPRPPLRWASPQTDDGLKDRIAVAVSLREAQRLLILGHVPTDSARTLSRACVTLFLATLEQQTQRRRSLTVPDILDALVDQQGDR